MRRDLGDFQTPPDLVSAVLDRLDALGVRHARAFEPTCGRGHFVAGLLGRPDPPREVIGFEIQAEHQAVACGLAGPGTSVAIERADLFGVDLVDRLRWRTEGPLLVVGNPPWVTSAEIGRLGGENGPARGRVAGVDGLDARTGRSNFDLAEAVWQKLLNELDEPGATIALLCKAATARAVLRWAARTARPVASATIHRVDARRWFAATVDACLFVVRLGDGPRSYRAEVYPDLSTDRPEATIGVVDGLVVADLDAFDRASFAFGHSPASWRQGVKHDAAPVMELVESDGATRNGLGEVVDVEPDRVYPLVKGSDLGRAAVSRPTRRVLVTQRHLGEDTRDLEATSPRLWAYLVRHAGVFAARRSKVYAGRPPFAMFGIGDYTFAPWKVAVSGLNKRATFRAIGPADGRPVLLDDTCYLLPVENEAEAARVAGLLNGPDARALIAALTFPDAKRPITKAVLSRIDLDALARGRPLATTLGAG